MGRPRNIHRSVKQHSRPASVASEEDELRGESAHVSAAVSPNLSTVQPQSQSGSSSHAVPAYEHAPYLVPLHYPGEAPDVYPYESASRQDPRERPQASRSNSSRREREKQKHLHKRVQTAHRQRRGAPISDTSSESADTGDSTEDFIEGSDYVSDMPRPQSYHAQNGYTHSSSSGSWNYPQVPNSQVVHYAAPPPPQQHPQPGHPHYPYPPMASPPAPIGYPPSDSRMRHDANNGGGHHYRPGGYGPGPVVHYGPQGYFPPGYPAPHQYPPGYHGGPNPYLPAFMEQWQVASHSRVASPPAEKKDLEKAGPAPPPGPSQEDIILRMQELLAQANEAREAKEKDRQLAIQSADDQVAAIRKAEAERAIEERRIREDALRQAKEQAEAAAKAHAERAAHEQRIREEAIRAAQKTIADKAAADAEQAAREARIREEAARVALENAEAAAKAKAEQEAKEKKIAADAAAEAKSAAEKKAAEDAAAKEEAAKTAKEEAEKKVKEAEEAAAKAKAEAEAAAAAAAAAKPPDKKPPVRFKDAIGRNYNFPWERCCKWRDMENLIIQAFQHIEDIGEHVINGRYDLIGPDKEIIMPQYWDYIVQPDMHITMMLWPLPPKPDPLPPPDLPAAPLGADIVDLDALLNGDMGKGKKPGKGKKGASGSAFAAWMLGAPRPRKTGKGTKKPDITAI